MRKLYFTTFYSKPGSFFICTQPYDTDSEFWEQNKVEYQVPAGVSVNDQFEILCKAYSHVDVILLKN